MGRLTKRDFLTSASAVGALTVCQGSAGAASAKAVSKPQGLPNGMDGVALASAIRKREMSPKEAVDEAIARVEAVEPKLNAIVSAYFEEAREIASSNAYENGPFAGVPTFIKDLYDWKGHRTGEGSRAFDKAAPATDDGVFPSSWRSAGMISLGKSSSPEFGALPSSQPLSSGPTRNPWDLSRDASGSSSGAAALVAARVVPFAHASDGGGSIRTPATTCGVFGLKPTRDRLPVANGPARDFALSVSHAETITVRDSVALFQIAEGDFSGGRLGDVKPLDRPLRIGLMTEAPLGTPVDPNVVTAIKETATLCENLGHKVEPFKHSFDISQYGDDFILLWAAGSAEGAQYASKASGKPIGPDILEPWTLGLVQLFQQRKEEFPAAYERLKAFQQVYEDDLAGIDVLLSPVTGRPATPLGELAPTVDFELLYERIFSFSAFTTPQNTAGAASMSVPLGMSPDGLPIGSLFSGTYGDDGLLFSLALQLEEAKNWHNDVPPVNALQV